MPLIYTMFVVLLLIAPDLAAHCPVMITPRSFKPPLPNLAMGQLRLFSWHSHRAREKSWQEEPLQIDPIDRDGRFIFYKDPKVIDTDPLEKKDRLTFDPGAFAQKFPGRRDFPCKAERLFETADPARPQHFVYLAFCADGTRSKFAEAFPVTHHVDKREVSSNFYTFRYSKKNHILFDHIRVHSPKMLRESQVAAHSQIRLHANMKKFFNFDFDSKDIESRLETERPGRVGFIGFAAFYLKILFMSIDLKLYTGISFLPRTVSIPMVMHMPVNPRDWVNPGSGIMYSWDYDDKDVTYTFDEKLMPKFDGNLILKDPKGVVKLGLKFCAPSGVCVYRLPGRGENFSFTMDFILPRSVVKRGFFPMLVENLPPAFKELGWDHKDGEEKAGRIGLYYETSQLSAGEHHWDFWIRMSEKPEELSATCPYPVKAAQVLQL